MAEQQLTQEQLGPGPKPKQTTQVTGKPPKQPEISPIPAPKDQTKIQLFESPTQQIPKMIEEEKQKEPKDLTWLSSSFSQYKALDTKHQNFTPENRMKINSYKDAFQVKNNEIKRHQKVIDGIVTKTTSDLNIDDLTKIDANGNRYLDKERLRRIVTRKVENLGGNEIVADYVFSKASVAAENRFGLNNQKKVFETKLQTANIKKPKDSAVIETEFKDIQLSARGEMKVAQESVKSELIKESEIVNAKYIPEINNILIQAPYSMEKAIEDANIELSYENADYLGEREYFEGMKPRVSNEEVIERANALFQAKNQDYLTTQYLPVIGQMQGEIKSLSNKYNNILNRKRGEIQSSYEKKFSEMKALYDKEANDYNTAIDKLWNEAGEDLKNQYETNMKAVYEALGAGANFTKNFMKSAGGMLSGIGSYLRMNGIDGSFVDFLASAGQDAQMYNNTYTPSVKDAYLSPKYWAGAVGETLGSSAVIAGATIATRNPFIGALLSNIVEGSSMAGSVYNQQILEGKDPVQASSAASEVARMNLATMPLNALQAKLFMPFTKGAGFTGAFKKVTTGALGGTLEEMGQATFEEGKGFQPQKFYAPETLEMGVRVFGAQMFMGAPGGAMSGLVQNITTNKNNPSALAQVASRMNRENGDSRLAAVGEALNITGEINDDQAAQIRLLSEAILDIENEANSIGLEGDKKDAFVGITYDIRELEKKKETVKSESAKAVIDNQISEKKKQLSNIINDKTELAAVVIAGTKVVVPVEEAAKIVGTDQFAEAAADGDVQIETTNADLTAKVEEAKQQKTRQRNIISDTGQIIEELPTEAAPVTEAAPAATAEDIERRRQEELDRSTTANNAVIAADYLFTGGRDVMLSTDYLLQALIGSFPSAGKAIDAIRIKYGSRIGNIKDDVNSQVYQEMMAEIRGAINNTYDNQRIGEIFNKILENPTGFTFREGNAISAELETLNQQQEDKINAKYDAELASLQTIKTQEDATQISERPQQEIPQPSNLVQPTGVEQRQQEVGQAEGGVGQTTQQGADARNRDFGSQAQQVVQEITALPEQTPIIQNYTTTINPGQEVQLMDELSQQVTENEEAAVRQMGQPVVDKVKQWIADTGYTAPAAPIAEAAPVAEAPMQVDELLTADTKVPTNLEKVFNFLDGIDKSIDKNLKSGTLRSDISVIPLAAIQTMVKALKALVQGGMALQDAIRKVAADNNYTEKDVLDSIKIVSETEGVGKDVVVMSAREYIRDSISTQIKAIENVKDRANAIKEAVANVIDNISQNYGAAFTLSAAAIKQLNKNLVDAVFYKMDDATAIDDVIAKVSPIVEYAVRRQMLSGTEKLLDKLKSNYKSGRYSGAARLSIMENLLKADASKWLNSNASLEDISLFNEYLKELTGKDASTANLDAAVALSNKFVPTPQQSTITEKDSLNNKINNLAQKAADGKIDFADYSALVSLEKAINDINERKGALTGLTDEERNDIIANYNKLISSLPKPIDQLLADAQAKIDADIKGKVGALGVAIETSQEFRDSIKNPFIYEAVLKFRNEMTDEFINSLTPKEKMLLSANIDEILRGNPNSTTYEFSAKAGAFVQAKTNYNIAKKIFSKRQVINNSGVTGFFGKVRRLFMDIDYNRASAERMAASFDLFKLHMMDVELNTGSDEFDMGDLEKKIFGPLARAIDSAFNKVTDSLGAMQEAMKLLNDKSNKQAIKKGIGLLNKELGTGFFGGKAKWMHIKKLLGYGNSFYMEISTRMATIVATQIDHISNLQDGESAKDVVLLRNILEQKPEDYDGRTMKEHYQTNPSAITDKTDDASLFDHIAYGILTKGGVNKLSDLTKDELLALLTESQKKAIAKWREHIDNTRNVVEAAMIMRGGVTAFLNEYFPRRVFSKDGVTEIKSIEEYINQAGGNVGVDSGQLKARSGEVGRLDLNGNSVLYNNLKDIYLIHEVKPILDSIKGLDNAVETLKKERDLGSATYAEAVSIAVANRVKNSLESNERISNNNYSFWYRTASKVSSIAARVILISQIRAVADFLSNVTKLSASLAFANKSLKNQIFKSVTPGINSYTTDKGTFKWDDYVKIALTTGSSVHRIMSNYADNFLYEFSKPKEQLQREQRVGAWQDMAVKKAGWMNKFEVAFQRITGESFDHKAFADERGAYRAMYLDSVQRASDAADSYIDRQYNLASIARQPIRVNIFAPFVGRASRNLFGKAPTIAKNNPASVILGFLTGYPTVQFQLFSRYMRRALSMDRDVSAKTRVEDISKALTEVIVPSIMYNVIRATTGILFTTTAAAVMAAGDDQEDRKRLYKEMEEMPFWKRWFAKTRIAFGEKEESLRNAVINGMLSSAIDPNVNALVRPFAGFLLFKMWKENAIEDMMTKGKTKKEIEEARQKIKEYENTLFESYSIRPIELFGTEQYAQSIKIHYGAKAQFEGVEDVIKSTAGFGILYNEVSRTMDLTKMINATDENQGLSETELYVASALKLGGVTFANMILGGKAGAALSMLSGDMNKVANMMISDQKSIQTGFEISKNKKGKKGGGSKKSRGGTQGRGGGARGGVSRGGAGGGAR
jgi:hypothetical protein